MINSDLSTDRMSYLLKSLLKISMPIAVASAITTFGGFIDTITINHYIRKAISDSPLYFSEKFGFSVAKESLPNFIYGSYTGLALTVFGLIPSLTSIFGKSILPVISEDMAKKDFTKVSEKINSVLLITSLISFPSAMGIYVFSKEILKKYAPLTDLIDRYCLFSRNECMLFLVMQGRDFIQRGLAAWKRHDNFQGYDDLIVNLHKALKNPDQRLCRALRSRFNAGIIDEFQDTDAQQYEIFEEIFINFKPYFTRI